MSRKFDVPDPQKEWYNVKIWTKRCHIETFLMLTARE